MNTNSYYGKKNSNWKGNSVSLRAKHYRITAKRGKASEHKCARCHKSTADDWAEIHGKKGHYMPLCRHCHHIYDKNIQNIQKHDSRYSLKEELIRIAKGI